MEYKVPQNIDIEDKIVGPLTLRQFVIILIAGSIVVILNFLLTGVLRFLFFLIAIPVIGGGLGLAFFDYGGQHLEKIVADAILTTFRPKRMIWKKEQETLAHETQNTQQTEIPTVVHAPSFEETKSQLQKFATRADMPGAHDPLLNENPFLEKKMNEASAMNKKKEPLLSQLASVSPDQKFEYPKIETKNNPYK